MYAFKDKRPLPTGRAFNVNIGPPAKSWRGGIFPIDTSIARGFSIVLTWNAKISAKSKWGPDDVKKNPILDKFMFVFFLFIEQGQKESEARAEIRPIGNSDLAGHQ